MSEIESELALASPAFFAVLSMMVVGGGNRHGFVAVALTGLVALVIGFFVTFTIAWSVTNSALLIWLSAIAIGVVIGMGGHLLTWKKARG